MGWRSCLVNQDIHPPAFYRLLLSTSCTPVPGRLHSVHLLHKANTCPLIWTSIHRSQRAKDKSIELIFVLELKDNSPNDEHVCTTWLHSPELLQSDAEGRKHLNEGHTSTQNRYPLKLFQTEVEGHQLLNDALTSDSSYWNRRARTFGRRMSASSYWNRTARTSGRRKLLGPTSAPSYWNRRAEPMDDECLLLHTEIEGQEPLDEEHVDTKWTYFNSFIPKSKAMSFWTKNVSTQNALTLTSSYWSRRAKTSGRRIRQHKMHLL